MDILLYSPKFTTSLVNKKYSILQFGISYGESTLHLSSQRRPNHMDAPFRTCLERTHPTSPQDRKKHLKRNIGGSTQDRSMRPSSKSILENLGSLEAEWIQCDRGRDRPTSLVAQGANTIRISDCLNQQRSRTRWS